MALEHITKYCVAITAVTILNGAQRGSGEDQGRQQQEGVRGYFSV